MKIFLIAVILLFTGFKIYPQSLEFSCWTDETESIVLPEVQDAIASNSTYNEVVIIAKDYKKAGYYIITFSANELS